MIFEWCWTAKENEFAVKLVLYILWFQSSQVPEGTHTAEAIKSKGVGEFLRCVAGNSYIPKKMFCAWD